MNKKIGIIVGIAIVGLLGATALLKPSNTTTVNTEETVTVSHRGGETTVKKNPENVVVLDYGSVDILDEMGVDIKALPKSSLPSYLGEFKGEEYIDLGELKEFDIEKINEIKPELIVIEGRQGEYYDELSKIAPTVYLGSDGKNYYESVKRNIDVLGTIFDKEEEGDKLIADFDARIAKISEKTKAENMNALTMMITDGSMSVYGEGSRFSLVYNELGFQATDKNIEVASHGQNVSYEYLLSKNPQYLFVIDKGEATGDSENNQGARDVLKNEIIEKTETYKNGNIIYLNSAAWYVGGAGVKSTDLMLQDIESSIGI